MSSEDNTTACPVCSKSETPKAHDLVCGECVHDSVEVIRNSVLQNEHLNLHMRKEINIVFEACKRIQNHDMSEEKYMQLVVSQPDVIYNNVRLQASPSPGYAAVKNLALQLQRLETLNWKLKLNGIQRTHANMAKKVQVLQDKIASLTEDVEANRAKINSKKTAIIEGFTRHNDRFETEIVRLQGEGMARVSKQANNLHYGHYKVLREVTFPNFERWKSGKGRTKEKLLFHGQPILSLSSFLSHNNKLTAMNTFLENVIQLQATLSDLFRIENDLIELPYLDYLKRLLPESKFFDLVQEKTNFIVNDGKPPQESDDPTENNHQIFVEERPIEIANDSIDKIVVKDNVIRVPISFKTVNLQRRASIRSEKEDDPEPKAVEPQETTKPQATKISLKGKKIVVVPHKILTKPFTKLSLKEYLKFILIVVKILVNFKVFFNHTTDKIRPPSRLKHQPSTSTLTNTFNHLRNNTLYGSVLDAREADDAFDFEKILAKIADMDLYFKQRLPDRLTHHSSSGGLSSLSNSNLTTGKSMHLSELEPGSDISASLVNIHSSQISTGDKVSRMRALYDNFFHKKVAGHSVPSDENIYGLVSETHTVPGASTEMLKKEEIAFEIRQSGDVSAGANSIDLKEITEMVHKLVANGNGGSRAHSMKSANDEAVRLATLSMMTQSRAQLDEWDVVSKMY